MQSRYYDPETGRFLNADAIAILDEAKEFINGLNLFAYCSNNPVMLTDESGKAWWDRFWKALVVIAVVAIAVAVTIATCGAGSVGGAMLIAGAIGMGAEVFSQTVIQGKSFGEVNWGQALMAGFGGMLMAIPGVGLMGAMLIGGGTNFFTTLAGGGTAGEAFASFGLGFVASGIGFGVGKFVSGKIGNKMLANMSKSQLKKLASPFVDGAARNSFKTVSSIVDNKATKHLLESVIPAAIRETYGSTITALIGFGLSFPTNKWLFNR